MPRCRLCGDSFTPTARRQEACRACVTVATKQARKLVNDEKMAAYLGTSGQLAAADLASRGSVAASISSEEAVSDIGSTHLKFVLWPDTHFPFHDEKAVALGLKVVRYYKPDIVYLLGDMIDCTGFGRFKHSLTDKRTFLATELELFREFGQRLNDASPKSTKFFIEGNHEARVEKWAMDHPQLTGLEEMDISKLLWLDKLGYANNGKTIIESELANGELTFTHGTHTGSNKAGFAARAEMARFGTSGASGHTHRLATYMEKSKRGVRVWIESGHMSQHQPHYMKTLPNWQQGLVIGEAARDGNDFEMEAIPFRLSYKCRVRGREIS